MLQWIHFKNEDQYIVISRWLEGYLEKLVSYEKDNLDHLDNNGNVCRHVPILEK